MKRCNCNNGKGQHTHMSQTCVECEVPQLARNNYFTGKLLVERDFTDEQRYLIGKDRRHNQWLHGWGAVCGLAVRQHEDPNCRDQYVIVEPGTAVDCCGREIVLTEEQLFPFRRHFLEWWRAQHGPEAEPDKKRHTLRITLKYAECPYEEVPVLFDECSPDGGDCAPNRIRESFELGMEVDPKPTPHDPSGIDLKWRHTINVDNAYRVAVDEKAGRVYVLTAEATSKLYVYRLDNHSLVAAHALPGSGKDLALSADGSRAYVAVEQHHPDVVSVFVLDTGHLGHPDAVVRELRLSCPVGGRVFLAVSPTDGRLYVLNADGRQVIVWSNAINHPGASNADALVGHVSVGERPRGIVVTPNGETVFVANSGGQSITAIRAADLHPTTILLPNESPYSLAVAAWPSKPKLFVADREHKTVRVLDIPPGAPEQCKPVGHTHSLSPHTPIDLVASPGGRWLFVLLRDPNGKGSVQVVDAYRLEAGEKDVAGHTIPVGQTPRDLGYAPRAGRLYAAYEGRPDADGYGGVAVIDAITEPCADIFHRSLDECPTCHGEELLVLATIKDYVWEQAVDDGRIDNLADRRLLPSVSLLAEVVACMLDGGVGAGGCGEPGEPGPKGEPGEQGEQGEMGDGLNPDLTHLCAINWPHGDYADAAHLAKDGLLVAFDRKVRLGDIHRHSFILLTESHQNGVTCWCEVVAESVKGIALRVDCDSCQILGIDPDPCSDPDDLVNGAQLWPGDSPLPPGEYRVMLKGDFIRDELCRAVDANHLPPWLPKRPTGDWVEGGTFESWFMIADKEQEYERDDYEQEQAT
jgi:DNA-binding beta-propeller fold protein YncE